MNYKNLLNIYFFLAFLFTAQLVYVWSKLVHVPAF